MYLILRSAFKCHTFWIQLLKHLIPWRFLRNNISRILKQNVYFTNTQEYEVLFITKVLSNKSTWHIYPHSFVSKATLQNFNAAVMVTLNDNHIWSCLSWYNCLENKIMNRSVIQKNLWAAKSHHWWVVHVGS